MNWQQVAESAWVARLGWTLLHSLWQGIAVALVLALVLRLLHRRSAQARYLASCAALAALPLAMLLTALAVQPPARDEIRMTHAAIGFVDALALLPNQPAGDIVTDPATPAEVLLSPAQSPRVSLSKHWRLELESRLEPALPWLVGLWLAGALLLAGFNLGAWGVARRLRRRWVEPADARLHATLERLRERLGVTRPVALLLSRRIDAPALLGWLKPAILLPVGVLTGLTPAQVEAILAHELAHIRRHDYLVNLAQTAIESLLFYHPATWWISRRIRVEREFCCDDMVLRSSTGARDYALALVALEAARMAPAGPMMAATGGTLMNRIQRLLGVTTKEKGFGGVGVAAALAALLLLALVLTTATVVMAPPLPAQSTATLPAEPNDAPFAGEPNDSQTVIAPLMAVSPPDTLQLSKMAGYVDFNAAQFGDPSAATINVELTEPLLRMLANVEPTLGKDVAEILDNGLKLVRVQVFEETTTATSVADAVRTQVNTLLANQWTPTVRVNDGDEQVNILMRQTDSGKIGGIAALITDGESLVFVNVVGDLDAEKLGAQVGQLMQRIGRGELNMEELEKMLGGLQGGKSTGIAAPKVAGNEKKGETVQYSFGPMKEANVSNLRLNPDSSLNLSQDELTTTPAFYKRALEEIEMSSRDVQAGRPPYARLSDAERNQVLKSLEESRHILDRQLEESRKRGELPTKSYFVGVTPFLPAATSKTFKKLEVDASATGGATFFRDPGNSMGIVIKPGTKLEIDNVVFHLVAIRRGSGSNADVAEFSYTVSGGAPQVLLIPRTESRIIEGIFIRVEEVVPNPEQPDEARALLRIRPAEAGPTEVTSTGNSENRGLGDNRLTTPTASSIPESSPKLNSLARTPRLEEGPGHPEKSVRDETVEETVYRLVYDWDNFIPWMAYSDFDVPAERITNDLTRKNERYRKIDDILKDPRATRRVEALIFRTLDEFLEDNARYVGGGAWPGGARWSGVVSLAGHLLRIDGDNRRQVDLLTKCVDAQQDYIGRKAVESKKPFLRGHFVGSHEVNFLIQAIDIKLMKMAGNYSGETLEQYLKLKGDKHPSGQEIFRLQKQLFSELQLQAGQERSGASGMPSAVYGR